MRLCINKIARATTRKLLGDGISARIYGKRLAWRIRAGQTDLHRDPTLQTAKDLVSTGDCVIDVGALGGDWSYVLGQRVGRLGLILAIEADPFFAKVLKAAFGYLEMPQVQVIHTALGAVTQTASLAIKKSNGDELLGFSYIETEPRTTTVSIPMTTLDALRSTHPRIINTRLVKIDTEGYEPFIIQGGAGLLSRNHPILICEVNSEWLKRFGWTPSGLYSLLLAKGYKPASVNGGPVNLEELKDRFEHDASFSEDVTFLHQDN
jgi:FkbM family methyltransferase